MTTLLSRVKFFDSAKGFGFACYNEPGRPDVFLTDAVLREKYVFALGQSPEAIALMKTAP